MERNLRKCQNTLYISGIGVIILGIWSVLKTVLNFTLNAQATRKMVMELGTGRLDEPEYALTNDQYYIAFIVITCIILVIDLLIRLYIGLKAMREGKGRQTGYKYIVFASLLTISFVFSIYGTIVSFMDDSSQMMDIFDKISVLVVDFVSFIMSFDMVISAIRVKIILRKLKNRNAE